MKRVERPTSTVIVAVRDDGAVLPRCLDSLRKQTLRGQTEIIVVNCSGKRSNLHPAAIYPGVSFLESERSSDCQQTLKLALIQATGDFIAFTDSCCSFAPDWLKQLRQAHALGFVVAGGSVEPGGQKSLVGWATFFADYGAFMLPGIRSETGLLAGNNVSYARETIANWLDEMPDGYWKAFLHGKLEECGVRFLFEPNAVVYCESSDSVVQFARRYFRDARGFAAMRAKTLAHGARLWHVATTPALPAVLLYRRVRAAWGKRRRGTLLLCVPLLSLFVTVWSLGELVGYVAGMQARSSMN